MYNFLNIYKPCLTQHLGKMPNFSDNFWFFFVFHLQLHQTELGMKLFPFLMSSGFNNPLYKETFEIITNREIKQIFKNILLTEWDSFYTS